MAVVCLRRRPSLLLPLLRPFCSSSPSPSGHAFDPEIRLLAKSKRFSDIESLLEPRKAANLPHDPSSRESYLCSYITAYASAGMLDQALRTLDENHNIGSRITVLSINALLSACNHCKTLSLRVPDLFSDLFRSHSLSPDKVSYGILIKSLCLSGDASKALQVFKEMEGKKIEITTVSYTTVMDSLYKEGKPEGAEQLWKEMYANGASSDVAAYNTRIMYRAINGKPSDVLELMEEMKAEGMEPDVFTFNYLMTCYCKHGMIDDAMRVYRELGEKGCEPNAATFRNLLYQLCRRKNFVAGFEVFNDSVKKRKVPDLGSLLLLVKGLMKGSKASKAKTVVIQLKKTFPEKFEGGWKKLENVVGLSSIEKVPEIEA